MSRIRHEFDGIHSDKDNKLSPSHISSLRRMVNDAKKIFISLTRVLNDEVRRVFNEKFTSRQGIAGFFSSGSWILPTTIALTGLTFREEISDILGKFSLI